MARISAFLIAFLLFMGGSNASAQGNPSFSFVNSSNQTILELYVSSSRQNTWGSDRLGSDVLQPGAEVWIDLPSSGGCRVDVRVVYTNGQDRESRNVETCSRGSVYWR